MAEMAPGSSPPNWALREIGLGGRKPAASGAGVRIAILDTGIDPRHPDFIRRRGTIEHMWSFVPGENAIDRAGHGTHCAGIIAGPAVSIGGPRYGIAPGARLLIAKVLSRRRQQGPVERILEAVEWACDLGARIISFSAGTPRPPGWPWDERLEETASRLLSGSPGVLLIAPSGNDSARPAVTLPVESPACCPSVLSVAATGRDGRVAPFSHGDTDGVGAVDISAPGASIHSAWVAGLFHLTSGTSAAVPHVAGAAALWLEQEPSLSARELRARLLKTARPAGARADCGAGIVQVPAGGETRR